MNVAVNPGAGPICERTLQKEAARNIAAFRRDLALHKVRITYQCEGKHGGRYTFLLRRFGRECMVDMPGLPLERVRYMKQEGQNPWHFPRLYVDGNSWLWIYALDSAREALLLQEPDVLETLRKRFGTTWFNARDSQVALATLKRLVQEGKLNSSRPPGSGPLNFQVPR